MPRRHAPVRRGPERAPAIHRRVAEGWCFRRLGQERWPGGPGRRRGAARCEERDGNGFDGGKVVSVLSVLDLFGRFARSWWGSIYMDLLELLVQIGTFRK